MEPQKRDLYKAIDAWNGLKVGEPAKIFEYKGRIYHLTPRVFCDGEWIPEHYETSDGKVWMGIDDGD